jgi:hypothetical protein
MEADGTQQLSGNDDVDMMRDAAHEDIRWNGPSELAAMLVPIESIQHHPENPRRGDVNVVAESLGHFGQLKPIILHVYAGQDTPTIVAGNHTTRGAKTEISRDGVTLKQAWTHIAAVNPVLTDEQADQYLLMDNRSSDLATNDDAMLSAMLQRMMDAGQLDGTGYTPDDVDDLLSSIGAVAETAPEEFTGDYAESPDDTASRYTTPGEGVRMKEALLMYPEDQYAEFTGMLKLLQKAWGIDSTRDVVFEALKRAVDSGLASEQAAAAE